MGCSSSKSTQTDDQKQISNNNSSFIPENIIKALSKSVVRIEFKGKSATGFFMKINLQEKNHNFLLTNDHCISKKDIDSKLTIRMYYGKSDDEVIKEIKLDNKKRFIKSFIDSNIDATLVEILPSDKIKEKRYLFPDLNYVDGYDQYIKTEIYTAGYPNVCKNRGEKHFSSGKIIDYKNKKYKIQFLHNSSTKEGSSGSPLINSTMKVIGIHYGCNNLQTLNHGVFIGEIIKNLKKEENKIILHTNGEGENKKSEEEEIKEINDKKGSKIKDEKLVIIDNENGNIEKMNEKNKNLINTIEDNKKIEINDKENNKIINKEVELNKNNIIDKENNKIINNETEINTNNIIDEDKKNLLDKNTEKSNNNENHDNIKPEIFEENNQINKNNLNNNEINSLKNNKPNLFNYPKTNGPNRAEDILFKNPLLMNAIRKILLNPEITDIFKRSPEFQNNPLLQQVINDPELINGIFNQDFVNLVKSNKDKNEEENDINDMDLLNRIRIINNDFKNNNNNKNSHINNLELIKNQEENDLENYDPKKYDEKLNQIKNLGFTDENQAKSALVIFKGDMVKVKEFLEIK